MGLPRVKIHPYRVRPLCWISKCFGGNIYPCPLFLLLGYSNLYISLSSCVYRYLKIVFRPPHAPMCMDLLYTLTHTLKDIYINTHKKRNWEQIMEKSPFLGQKKTFPWEAFLFMETAFIFWRWFQQGRNLLMQAQQGRNVPEMVFLPKKGFWLRDFFGKSLYDFFPLGS